MAAGEAEDYGVHRQPPGGVGWAMGHGESHGFLRFLPLVFFGFRNGEVTLIYTDFTIHFISRDEIISLISFDFTILFISRDEIISVIAAESLLKPWPWPVHCFSHYRW